MRPITSLLLLTTALARGVDYLSELPDVGRTGWLRDEKVYTKANVKDSKLLSKVKLDTAPRVKHNLYPPLIVEPVTTVEGVNQMAVVSGVSDGLFGAEAGDGPYDPENGPPGNALVA
jgi:hypothetical protein